jgi:hypothetical protein
MHPRQNARQMTPKAKSCAPEKIAIIEVKNENPGTLPSWQ